MALPIYVKLEGIEGSGNRKGIEGMVEVVALDYTVDRPTQADTGLATGDRVHRPYRILKVVDKSSPLLHQALCNGQVITKVEVNFYFINEKNGQQTLFYKQTLENATICELKTEMQHIEMDATRKLRHQEWVGFRFQKITSTFIDGQIEFTDDFLASERG
jgi:type VI secretion system secreted protein Hcp